MEGRVARMLELSFRETFVVVDGPVANELDLGDPWYGLEIRMQDRFLRALSFVVAVSIAL